MALTYYLIQMNPVLLFLLIVSITGVSSGVGTYYFRRHMRLKVMRAHNEVTGFFFTAVAGFYALMLSFVVFIVWDELNDIQRNVSLEGSAALGLYRDIKFYPETNQAKHLNKVYMDFVFNVINEEIPNMSRMEPSLKTAKSFNKVYYTLENLSPQSTYHSQLLSQMFHHLNELARYRNLRTSSMNTEIPSPIWIPILIGGLITIVCGMLVDIENIKLHVWLNAMLGSFIGMLFFIVILFDHPFTGSLAVEPKSYMEIFVINELPTNEWKELK